MCVAGLSALLLKYCRMRDHPDFLFGELSVLCCFPYLAFTLSEGVANLGVATPYRNRGFVINELSGDEFPFPVGEGIGICVFVSDLCKFTSV